MPLIENFGRNVRFTCAQYYEPRSDEEVLDILRRHRGEKIRCIGALHSWSEILVTEGVMLDLRHFDSAELAETKPEPLARLGAGCTIGRALKQLEKQGYTLPTVGAIKKQTIAGAISTGTHGSGAPGLSHFVEEVRLATFDPGSGEPAIVRLRARKELRAARCGLGALGVILDVKMRAVPAYRVKERFVKAKRLGEILEGAAEWPLQQFFLVPWKWRYMVYRRQPTEERETWLHVRVTRLQLFLIVDVLQHALLKWVVLPLSCVLGAWVVRVGLRRMPIPEHRRVDDASEALTLRHDLFRHVEMEVFVPEGHLRRVARDVRSLIELGAGVDTRRARGLAVHLPGLRGRWTHHYPVVFRRILPEDTLISMASGSEAWVSISFFTYRRPDAGWRAFTSAVARWLVRRYDARVHWGKYSPLSFREASRTYPVRAFNKFEAICLRYDRAGVFWNESLSDSTRR